MKPERSSVTTSVKVQLPEITISGWVGKPTVQVVTATRFGAFPLISEKRIVVATPEILQVINILEGLILTQLLDGHSPPETNEH